MLGSFQADIDSLPPLTLFPLPTGPASGFGPQHARGVRALLAPFALRDWCRLRPDWAGPALRLAGEEWIPTGQLDLVAAKGSGPRRRVSGT